MKDLKITNETIFKAYGIYLLIHEIKTFFVPIFHIGKDGSQNGTYLTVIDI